MANNSSHTMLYALGGIILIGGYFAWKYYTRQNRRKSSNTDSSHTVRPSEIYTKPEPQPAFDLKEHIVPILTHFSGCLNSLSDVINEDDTDSAEITFRNIELIVKGHGDDILKKYFLDEAGDRKLWSMAIYKDKATQIKKLLVSCGLTASTEKKLTWNANAAKHYRKLFKVEEGQVCDVIAPCWIYKNQIFEQGLVKAAE